MKRNLLWRCLSLCLVLFMVSVSGCSPDYDGSLGNKATASFTITPVTGKANTYALQSTSSGAIGYMWDKGTGQYLKGNAQDTAYFAVHGTYMVGLRAFGRGGYDSVLQSVTVAEDDILNNVNFQKLIAHSWKLDGTGGANAVIVGTEGNPSQYFAGGALDDCQKDDIYTFTADLTLSYNANGATFNAGNISPNYTCSTDRSYTGITIGFNPTVSAGEGIAAITLPGAVPAQFIGVTDVSSNNYRIISINDTEMVLRSGTATETVHQFKFVVAD